MTLLPHDFQVLNEIFYGGSAILATSGLSLAPVQIPSRVRPMGTTQITVPVNGYAKVCSPQHRV